MPPVHVIFGMSQTDKIRVINAIERGDVLKLDLKGAQGKELRGPHYCVVISNNIINKQSDTLVVVPLSTHGGTKVTKTYEVALKAGEGGLESDGSAIPHLVRSIDASARVQEVWGQLPNPVMEKIEELLGWIISTGVP